MRVGYVNPEYCAMRMIIGKCPGYEYVRIRSFKSLVDTIKGKLGLLRPGLQPYYFCGGFPQDFHRVDFLHFWNNVALWPCKTPYITSFEAELPRKFPEGWMMRKGIESLLSNFCRKLVAFSKRTESNELRFAREHGFSEIESKMTVLLPPQEVLVSYDDISRRINSKGSTSTLRLIFVGKDFFRKGGAEIAKALVKLRKDFSIEAFLVGKFDHVDYASSWEVDSVDEMRKLFYENESWLHHYPSMPNAEILNLAKTCHIGLLPTRDDTFGYSVLEFQACGLPCVTTNVCSLPEINNDSIGWMVNVTKLSNGSADFSTSEKMRELAETTEKGLIEKLREALSNTTAIGEKGLLALENIKSNHSPEEYGQQLVEIYEKAVL